MQVDRDHCLLLLSRGLSAAALGALATLAVPVALAQTTLRLVPQADLKILDTVQTTNNITSNHGYMIYDTLFSLDSKLAAKPQMVESYSRSPDALTWKFKLRPGLRFHDGQAVTADDAVASILRFAKRIPAGVTMMSLTPIGSPWSGPRWSRGMRSSARAASITRSGSTNTNA